MCSASETHFPPPAPLPQVSEVLRTETVFAAVSRLSLSPDETGKRANSQRTRHEENRTDNSPNEREDSSVCRGAMQPPAARPLEEGWVTLPIERDWSLDQFPWSGSLDHFRKTKFTSKSSARYRAHPKHFTDSVAFNSPNNHASRSV